MRRIAKASYVLCALMVASCNTAPHSDAHSSNVTIANQFIDAFYSFDRGALQSMLSSAGQSQPEILYYQKWAECANYKVLDRTHAFARTDSTVIFPVTVEDDLMEALGIDFNVTDTFQIVIQKERITSVKTSSNDLDVYYEAKEWVARNRPALIEKPCEGIWNGGATPCECVLGMIKGFMEFAESKTKPAQ